MKKGLFVLFIIIGIFSFRSVLADIAPMPEDPASFFTMKSEHVDISIEKNLVRVKADFSMVLEGSELPPDLQYCFMNPKTMKEECKEKYHQFCYRFPVIAGQIMKTFSVTIDGKEVDVTQNGLGNFDETDWPEIVNWLTWNSPRYSLKDVKRGFKTNIVVEYTQPINFSKKGADITYVLKTGSLWRGNIGRATIAVKSVYPVKSYSLKPTSQTSNGATWSYTNLDPKKDLLIKILK